MAVIASSFVALAQVCRLRLDAERHVHGDDQDVFWDAERPYFDPERLPPSAQDEIQANPVAGHWPHREAWRAGSSSTQPPVMTRWAGPVRPNLKTGFEIGRVRSEFE